MIIIAGIASEGPLRLAIQAAEAAGLDHVVVSQRHADQIELEVEFDGHGVRGRLRAPTNNGPREVDLAAVDGVYWRLMDSSALPEHGPGAAAVSLARSLRFHDALTLWVETAACRVANRLCDMGSNASKPFQALAIEQSGFATPPTLVTTVPADVEAVRRAWGPLVYKSTSSVRSIVRPLGDEDLEDVRHLPTQFQLTVDGTDVRVHVVGDAVHATEVVSDAVDYRYAVREGRAARLRPTELPADVADQCRDLSRRLRLPFCGIDLRRTPEDAWYCFEVNPSPGYSYYETHTGQPISTSLVHWLATGDATAAG